MEMEWGVSYHKGQVARLLKELKWIPLQREEAQVARWRKEVWLDMKEKRVGSIESLFLWTNRAFISCPLSSEPMRRVEKRPSCRFSKPATICP